MVRFFVLPEPVSTSRTTVTTRVWALPQATAPARCPPNARCPTGGGGPTLLPATDWAWPVGLGNPFNSTFVGGGGVEIGSDNYHIRVVCTRRKID
jgi:hypothetical protein